MAEAATKNPRALSGCVQLKSRGSVVINVKNPIMAKPDQTITAAILRSFMSVPLLGEE
jgi:hypothetical protein